jgi:hypothetical protein
VAQVEEFALEFTLWDKGAGARQGPDSAVEGHCMRNVDGSLYGLIVPPGLLVAANEVIE